MPEHQAEKVTTRWPGGPRTGTATVLRTDHREMGTHRPQNWRLTVPKTTKWCWSDHRWPIWRWLLEMTMLFLHVSHPPQSVYKSSHPLLLKGSGGWPLDRCPPLSPPPVASIWNKAKFPFHQPGLFIDFWVASSWTRHTPLLVTYGTAMFKMDNQQGPTV